MPRPLSLSASLLLLALLTGRSLHAQLIIQPQIGLQTMWFNGNYPVRQPISPGNDREAPLGGGIIGNTNAIHGQIEIFTAPEAIFRVPISAEVYFMNGKTTFAASRSTDPNPKRWLFQHSANIFTFSTGVMILPLEEKTFYVSVLGTVNHIPKTELISRIYYANTGETVDERVFVPDSVAHTRFGAYIKAGVQVDFFDPLMLDFSIGYGALNILGKESDPARSRNLLVVDDRPATEVTIGYIGFGLSVIWKE